MSDSLSNILSRLPQSLQLSISNLFSTIHLTESQKLEVVKNEADLLQWKEKSFISERPLDEYISKCDGRGGDNYILAMRQYMTKLRESETDYSSFFPKKERHKKTSEVTIDQTLVLSRCPCPVDGEKTRCCKLRTLDVIMQCNFGCSYCSVQAFYNENQIKIVSSLDKKLDRLELDSSVWHIGTGQASDSLLYGDDYHTLSSLANFATKHPQIVIELKSKAFRKDLFSHPWPKNMVFTWSLNARTIIEKEEHFTATLDKRIECARLAKENGNKIGFHIHPIFYYKGWEDGYKEVVEEIVSSFTPNDILMISMGTLTFTKAVIQRLREQGNETRVLEMPLTKEAGKYSYPLEIKERFFKKIYSYFPKEYKDEVFFYLCMEDPSLWPKVFGREYSCDKDFENDMKDNYYKKLGLK